MLSRQELEGVVRQNVQKSLNPDISNHQSYETKGATAGSVALTREKVWGFLKMSLAKEMQPQHYKAWVDNSSKLLDYDLDKGSSRVAVVNHYVQNWLANNANRQFQTVLSEVFARPMEVEFIVKPELFKTSKPADKPVPSLLDPAKSFQHKYQEAVASAQLNSKYSLEHFVVGLSNQLAHAAATAVVSSLGAVYNPLFVYGLTGTGKTHLLQGVGLKVLEKDPSKQVYYCSSEHFLNEMVEAIRSRQNHLFREKYRKLDVLLIDDIQFISKWEATQDELFHTFNALYEAGKQIVFVSDRPPSEIAKISDRLRSRFQGGMVADIHAPDRETRLAILQKRAQVVNSKVPTEALELIADLVDNNLRELEGAFNKLHTLAELSALDEQQISRAYIEKLLGHHTAEKQKRVQPKLILQHVCSEFNVRLTDLRATSRIQTVVLPRQIAMYLLRKELHLPFKAVATHLARNDHTTVIHAINKVEKLLPLDKSLQERINRIRRNW